MKKIFCFASILPVIFLLMCSGCATPHKKLYEGEKRPPSEVAVLKNSDIFKKNVNIIEIDGIPGDQRTFAETSYNNLFDGTYYIELLPGKHTLKVQYVTLTWRRPYMTTLEFEAKAGKVYTVKDQLEKTNTGMLPNSVKLWVEEIGDNPEIKK